MITIGAFSRATQILLANAAKLGPDTRTPFQGVGVSSKLATEIHPTATATVKGGGVQQTVPKKASSSMAPLFVVGGLAIVGLGVLVVLKKRKKS